MLPDFCFHLAGKVHVQSYNLDQGNVSWQKSLAIARMELQSCSILITIWVSKK